MLRHLVRLLPIAALAACGGKSKSVQLEPPEAVTQAEGFDTPMDAVSSPDGSTFFFSAHDSSSGEAAIYRVNASGGSPEVLHQGAPLSDPSGLVMSCDGDTLYIADTGYEAGTDGASPLYRMDAKAGGLTAMTASLSEANGLAIGPDCETLYLTGTNELGQAGLYRMSVDGGALQPILEGGALESPSGVYVDKDNVAWVMDQLPSNMMGGALYAITEDGQTSTVVDGLNLSEPAGVSLTEDGSRAAIPCMDDDGNSQMMMVELETGEVEVEKNDMCEPAGIRTARGEGVFAVVDTDNDTIYRVQY